MTGSERITKERLEQIEKHGWDETDRDYVNGELIQAGLFCVNPDMFRWPEGWHEHFRQKILNKNKIERLTVAGAFFAAEIDRIQYFIENA